MSKDSKEIKTAGKGLIWTPKKGVLRYNGKMIAPDGDIPEDMPVEILEGLKKGEDGCISRKVVTEKVAAKKVEPAKDEGIKSIL